jgi:hypothetical protein
MRRAVIAILTTILFVAVLVGLGRARALSRGQLRGSGLREAVPPLRTWKRRSISRAA